MKSKLLCAPAALSFTALLAMDGVLPAEEAPTKPAPSPLSDVTRELGLAYFDASEAGDLAKMKATYAALQKSDPHYARLSVMAFEIAMEEKDWPGVKRSLEDKSDGKVHSFMMHCAMESITKGKWEGAPKDLFKLMARETEAMIQAEGQPPQPVSHILLCTLHWHAGNTAKATEHARKVVQLAEEAKESDSVRAAAARFLKQVEGGTLPSMMEFMVWVQGITPEEPLAPDQGFDAPAHVGKPVEIKFTAADGTEVDLAKLKGKVVLVDFWATWCGPCVAEIPHVKEAYQKYHDKGFEIIGISFERADGMEKMMKFTKDQGMPWPQYYDGKGWNNAFGRKFSIQGIPVMWLIDKQGNLTELNARENLEEKVAKLLGS